MLDIITQNIQQRPICFANTTNLDAVYSKYTYVQGSVLVLDGTPKEATKKNPVAPLDKKKHENLLLDEFKLLPPERKVTANDNTISFIQNYRILYGQTAQWLIQQKDIATAKKILDKIETSYPPEKYGYDIYDIKMAQVYMDLGDRQKTVDYLDGIEKYLIGLNEKDWAFIYKDRYLQEISELRKKVGGE